MKRLVKSNNRMVCGVCAGIGEYLNVDPTVIRLLWVIFSIASFGTGLLAYIIAALIMPEAQDSYRYVLLNEFLEAA